MAFNPFNRTCKRGIDLLAASLLLLLASPLMLVTATLIRFWMGRPVLFLQVRPGRHERPFTLLKFRTMREACGVDGRPLPDAQRLTRLGRALRKSSLDELPQLWNVLKGEMSLVGPRPLLMEYLELYTERERRRHEPRPGITGLAQVSGRNLLSWDDRLEIDVQYVESYSLKLDARILWKTMKAVLRRQGVVVVPAELQGPLTQYRARGGVAASEKDGA
jgi:lipopolysaccharide/colanic/teichoic acid biosynthesis glycosyltransferase